MADMTPAEQNRYALGEEHVRKVAGDKLQALAEIEGYDDWLDLVSEHQLSGSVPGICTTEGCEHTAISLEPDSRASLCEECDACTIVACLDLMFYVA